MGFKAYRADGTEVQVGDKLTSFRGEDNYQYMGTAHPRKIMVRETSNATWARDGYVSREYFPSVFDLEIRSEDGAYVWNPVSEEGRAHFEGGKS